VGERVHRAFLFTDVCGFTRLSAERPPEEVSRLLNRYLGLATDAVHQHNGDVEKFIGDSVFAVFPSAAEAVRAARQLHEQAALAADEDRAGGQPGLRLRTGVNWGVALRTHVGNAERRDNTLIGEAVNRAARLQQAAGEGELLVSSTILDRAGDELGLTECRRLALKGIAEPVLAHALDVPGR
jgi:class 3 adenylate cyclase